MSHEQLAIVAAFSASCTWALGSTLYGRLAEQYSSSVINTTRACLALLGFLITMAFVDADSRQSLAELDSQRLTWLTVSMFSSYAFGDLLFLASTRIIGVPLALTLASVFPIWSAVAGFFYGDSLPAVRAAGLMVTVLGVATVIMSGSQGPRGKKLRLGYALGLATSVFWAVNTIAVAKGSQGLSIFVVGGVRMAIALVLCPLVGLTLRQNIWPPFLKGPDFRRYGLIFFIEAFLGTIFFVYAFKHASLAVAGTLASLAPVLSVPIGYFINREKIGWRKILGILIVTIGVALLLQ